MRIENTGETPVPQGKSADMGVRNFGDVDMRALKLRMWRLLLACSAGVAAIGWADTHYVDINSATPSAPYTNWATAATVIQDAVDAASAGDTALVAEGIYSITSEIQIAKAVRLQSVGGSDVTTVQSAGSSRCFALSNISCEVTGFLITNGYTTGYGGGVYCDTTTPVLRNCVLSGNRAKNCAGVYRGTLYGCTLSHNTASSTGGGAGDSYLYGCMVVDNVAKWGGGGSSGGRIYSSSVSGNLTEGNGGGCYGGIIFSCIISGNCAIGEGGGVYDSLLLNCIVYYNTAAAGPNFQIWNQDSAYCCTTPNPGGVGIITNVPLLTGVSHLSSASPCIGAGSFDYCYYGSDIDGEAWQTPPCIGCDQLVAGAATGALRVAIASVHTTAAAGWVLNFAADVQGRTSGNWWRFCDGTVVSNCPYVAHSWSATGRYDVVVTVQNDTFPEGISATARVNIVEQPVHYVDSHNASPLYPYQKWTHAATNIQDAIAAAVVPGSLVLVTNGIFETGGVAVYGNATNRIAVTNPAVVRSVNGPAVTVIRGRGPLGNGAVRCAYVGADAVLSGFTLTEGFTRASGNDSTELSGGGVWCAASARVSDCVLTSNSAAYAGGAACGGNLQNCTISRNSATRFGGGSYRGNLFNCNLSGNSAILHGGGAYKTVVYSCTLNGNACVGDSQGYGYGGGASYSTVFNSSLSGNSVSLEVGGAYYSALQNCTVVDNSAGQAGGGMKGGSAMNCIVYYNTAAVGGNYQRSDLRYCCTTPNPNSVGIITNPPLLTGLSHLSSASPCIGAGSINYCSGSDIDGETWRNPPCMGCDQLVSGAATGALSVAIVANYSTAVAGWLLKFAADVHGRTQRSRWNFGDGTVVSNCSYVSHAWSTTGFYNVVLTVQNDTFIEGISATAQVSIVDQPVHYVDSHNAAPLSPYQDWAHAATNIQDAVAVAVVPGSLVLVTNGVYETGGIAVYGNTTNRIALTNPVVVRSVNGHAVTAIRGKGPQGNGAVRCAYVGTDAVLSGFTLTDGHTGYPGMGGNALMECSGGGVWCAASACVFDCVITSNSASYQGGGAAYGTFSNCTLMANSAGYGGGVAYGKLYDCLLLNNSANNDGGGAIWGSLFNCTLRGNSAEAGGGVYGGGELLNCSVISNSAGSIGGGTCGGDATLYGCRLNGNSAVSGGGGAWEGTLFSCVLDGNSVLSSSGWGGGGAASATLFNCTLSGNTANNGGGIYRCTLKNCIAYYNTATNHRNNYDEGTFFQCCTEPLAAGSGNMTNGPDFADASLGDYRLRASSRCVNAGLNEEWMFAVSDIRGNPRVRNGTVDMGAYEFAYEASLRGLLQGAYDTNAHAMVSGLGMNVPVKAPYASDERTVSSVASNRIDWALVEVQDTNRNTLASTSIFLDPQGQVRDAFGATNVPVEVSAGSYYLVLKHRNHLSAMSAQPLVFTNTLMAYDFTTGPDKYFGGTNACVELEPGVWGLIGGDADGDGRITPVDREIVTRQRGKTGYLQGDLNLDGKVDGDD